MLLAINCGASITGLAKFAVESFRRSIGIFKDSGEGLWSDGAGVRDGGRLAELAIKVRLVHYFC